MPFITINDANYHYTDSQHGDDTIIFSHGLLWSGTMFEKQVVALQSDYRVITHDHRGQGQTQVTADGYDMETLYEDAVALITALDVAPVHFVGLSMGGFVGMRLASRRPDLLKSLILLETSADDEPRLNVIKYKLLAFVARWLGMGLVADSVMKIMFGETFLNDSARQADYARWRQALIDNDPVGVTRAVLGVVDRQPIYEEISNIKIPTLVMVGEEDIATVPAKAKRIHEQIKGSQFKFIPHAGHTSTVEAPDTVTANIQAFLDEV